MLKRNERIVSALQSSFCMGFASADYYFDDGEMTAIVMTRVDWVASGVFKNNNDNDDDDNNNNNNDNK
jgi:hypothetical protein